MEGSRQQKAETRNQELETGSLFFQFHFSFSAFSTFSLAKLFVHAEEVDTSFNTCLYQTASVESQKFAHKKRSHKDENPQRTPGIYGWPTRSGLTDLFKESRRNDADPEYGCRSSRLFTCHRH
jgi:hypothetical protein